MRDSGAADAALDGRCFGEGEVIHIVAVRFYRITVQRNGVGTQIHAVVPVADDDPCRIAVAFGEILAVMPAARFLAHERRLQVHFGDQRHGARFHELDQIVRLGGGHVRQDVPFGVFKAFQRAGEALAGLEDAHVHRGHELLHEPDHVLGIDAGFAE